MIAWIVALPLILPLLSLVHHLDNQLLEFRASAALRNATGDFVFVAIDTKSLTQVGTWPWPRDVHADVIDRLVAAGARDIFLDIDFSTPSRRDSDARLAKALSDAGGGVILPMFRQQSGPGRGDAMIVTAPIPLLAENAWPALVDVTLDADGLMRSFPVSEIIDGVPMLSAPAVLAGHSDMKARRLDIDFSIDPETVPTLSVADILSASRPLEAIQGKSVIVGAYATELKDLFAVPVHDILSGPMLHVLATETLVQDRLLTQVQAGPVALFLAALIVAYSLSLHRLSLFVPVVASLALLTLIELAAFLLYKHEALVFNTATLWIVLAFGLFVVMAEKMGMSGWFAEIAIAENRDIRRVLKRVINDSVDPILVLDQKLHLLDASQTTAEILGMGDRIPRGTHISCFAPEKVVDAVLRLQAQHSWHPEEVLSEHLELDTSCKEPRHLDVIATLSPFTYRGGREPSSVGSHVVCITLRDVTARRRYEQKLEEMNRLDELTGLLNRRGLIEAMTRAASGYTIFAIDLHRFSHLNETLGREKGDSVLKAVGARLRRHIGSRGLVARISGDVLCLAVPTYETSEALDEMALALLALFERHFDVDGIRIEINARVGACGTSSDLGPPAKWIEAAEFALAEAKRVSGSGWHAYDPASALRRTRSLLLEAELRSALEQNQFFLLYQPQVALSTGQVVGAEALMRWNHPTLGLISPLEFIGIAEANGFICDLGRFMFKEACAAAKTWPDHLTVAVNISPVQFLRGNIVADIQAALMTSGLAPCRLHIEITESIFLEQSDQLFVKLKALRALGIAIALDDFGTGYSSLSYISSLPLDKLKIDQSFIRNMTSDPTAQTIVQTITALAHGLGFKVVCEGIEDELQSETLRAMGCEEGQGYLFGRPQPACRILDHSAAQSEH